MYSHNSLCLNKVARGNICKNICYVIISGKELEHDGVCEISDRKHNDGLFVSDFTGFNRKDLALYCNLTDRTVNLFNGHLFIIKASSVHDIRVIIIFTSEISLALELFLELLFKLLLRLFISACLRFILLT